MQRHVGQNLTIEVDSGNLQPMHELAIGNPGRTAGGIDSDNPDGPVFALLVLTADVGELQSAIDRLHGGAVQLALGKKIAGGSFEHLLPGGPPMRTTFDSRHVSSPWI